VRCPRNRSKITQLVVLPGLKGVRLPVSVAEESLWMASQKKCKPRRFGCILSPPGRAKWKSVLKPLPVTLMITATASNCLSIRIFVCNSMAIATVCPTATSTEV
jgi:hypothetical protein